MNSEIRDFDSADPVTHKIVKKKTMDVQKTQVNLKEKDYQELAKQLAEVNEAFSGNLHYKIHCRYGEQSKAEPTPPTIH